MALAKDGDQGEEKKKDGEKDGEKDGGQGEEKKKDGEKDGEKDGKKDGEEDKDEDEMEVEVEQCNPELKMLAEDLLLKRDKVVEYVWVHWGWLRKWLRLPGLLMNYTAITCALRIVHR